MNRADTWNKYIDKETHTLSGPDCNSGLYDGRIEYVTMREPAEILEDGAYGPLVPVGDADALAKAILATLNSPPDAGRLQARAAEFSVERAVDHYLEVLLNAGSRHAS